jgi:hypothetical protein
MAMNEKEPMDVGFTQTVIQEKFFALLFAATIAFCMVVVLTF